MSRETVELLGTREEGQVLEARFVALERAYDDLLQRVRRYEQERREIRARLARILARMGAGGPATP
jgi:predicted  nucleic acid-binding Zn-ribbon protein